MKKVIWIVPLVVIGFFVSRSFSQQPIEEIKEIPSVKDEFIVPPLPTKVEFAGEEAPIRSDFDVEERFDKEIIQAMYGHSTTMILLKKVGRWKETIVKILKEQNIPEDFFYLMVTESHLASTATSYRGAQGFWQFMPETAAFYKMEVNAFVDERNDPIKATYAACQFFKDAYRKLNNWTLVAAAYNMGLGGLTGTMAKQKVNNYYQLLLNSETSRYVFRILALKYVLSNPESYGYKMDATDIYKPLETKSVSVNYPILDLVSFAQNKGTNFKILKLLNPWLLGNSLPNATGKNYTILLPKI